ncbi:MAG TPA: DUF1653 domain-containing protein [Candidatus Paceibacterota bacterium]|nr:DUF1653 domain-containing protein [Candidatus Paceibacterota bacterium]
MTQNPLYKTTEEAYAAPGEIYQHYKGGVYRLIQREVKHTETGEIGVVYEHLWPHDHTFFFRPQEMFFGKNEKDKERFVLIKRA